MPKGVTLDGTSLLPLFSRGKLSRPDHYTGSTIHRAQCVLSDGDWCLLADPEIELPRQNMFLEKFIGDIKKTGFINYRLHNLRSDATQEIDLSKKSLSALQK